LMERYQLPTGFSDHTEGWAAAAQAATLGACFIEKHFTTDHHLPGPDQWFSSTPEEFAELVRNVRLAEQRLGHGELQPAGEEAAGRLEYRISAVAARDLRVGERLDAEMVAYRRPGTGILPKDAHSYLGRDIVVPIAKGTPLQPDYFSPASGTSSREKL
jgi:N,N'-diacetyllegionaminate synthase